MDLAQLFILILLIIIFLTFIFNNDEKDKYNF